ncbi:MAG: hypothetical protein ABL993_03835 [Vicinamibacterales bacterium]
MLIRRVITLCAALAFLSSGSTLLFAQAPKVAKEQEKRNKQQEEDVRALVQLVDKVTAAEPVSPASGSADQRQGEIEIAWDLNHFIKSQDGTTYIPFSLKVNRPAGTSANTAVYVRAVNRNPPPAPAAASGDKKAGDDKDKQPARPLYAWDTASFATLKSDGQFQRAMALAGGEYDLFIAMKEQSSGDKKQMPKMGLLRHGLSVPDFTKDGLQTSSILVGAIEPLTSPLPANQQAENPYVFGTMKVEPTKEAKLAKAGELSLAFWIYGVSADPVTTKPNVLVEFSFHQKTAEGEKYFNKTAPQEFNAQSLPPEFSLAAGHAVPGGLAVPVMIFPAGDYRLEIKITDKAAGKSITQNVNFTVNAS